MDFEQQLLQLARRTRTLRAFTSNEEKLLSYKQYNQGKALILSCKGVELPIWAKAVTQPVKQLSSK